MNDAPDRTGLALVALSAVTWALAGVWVRQLPGVPLATVVAARLALALVVLLPVVWLRRRALAWPTRAAWGLAGVMVAYYTCAVAAFRLAPVAEATLFVNVSPLFAVAWARLRREPLTRAQRGGTALAFAGVVVILLPGALNPTDADAARWAGDALALLAALGMAVYAVLYQRLRPDAPAPLVVTTLTFTLGAVGLVGLVGMNGPAALDGLDAPAPWGALVGLAVVTTAVPTLAYSEAARRLPAVVTTTVRLLTPVVAAVAAWLVLGEVPSVWLAPGGTLVLGGLALSVRG